MYIPKKILGTAAVALLATALVAGCSSGGSKSKSNGSGPAQPPKASGNAQNQINVKPRSDLKQGGTFTWGISQVIPNFNQLEVDGSLLDTQDVEYGMLPIAYHFNAAGTASVDTDYFTAITMKSADPLTIEYKINPKAKWSDGSQLSVEDMAGTATASSGKAKGYNIAASQGYDQIKSVTAGANDQDAIVTFSTPYGDWRSLFAPILPKSLTATAAAFNTSWIKQPLVTSGPFKWGSADKTAQTYTIVRDDNWWGNKAILDSITFRPYSSPAAAIQAMGTKQVNYYEIDGGSTYQNIQAIKKFTGIDVRQAGGSNYRQFTFNAKDAILSDVKVRQAIFEGIDRARITTLLMGNLGGNPTPLDNHIFLKNQTAYKSTCGNLCKYDPAAAKSLLQSDGWTLKGQYYQKGGKTLSVAITIPADTPNALQESQTAQATLKAVGIQLKISTVPTNDFFPKYIIPGKFQITTFTWIGTPFPVGGSVGIYRYDPKNVGENYGSGGTDQSNALLNQSIQATDPTKENDLANQADAILWQNASWLPLYQRPQVFAATSTLANIGAAGFGDRRYEDMGYVK